MDKAEWVNMIEIALRESGTYKDAYVPVVDTLADILERRDAVLARYKKEGCKPMVTRTSDRGAKNKVKNPLLAILQEHEADALKYWTALGLTPASLKARVAEEERERKSGSALVRALTEMQRGDSKS